MRSVCLRLGALCLAAAAISDQAFARAAIIDFTPTERVIDLPTPNGGRQRVLFVAPARPLGAVVMFPGGAGDVGLEGDGDVRRDDNFVVRTRALWAAKGYAVLIPDTIDHANLRGVRSSPQYAVLVGQLVAYAHAQVAGPVFLLGTSQGSIAAMNGAAHARPGAVAGVVLTESVSVMGGSGETVFDADPADVRIPALVVASSEDQCDVAPASDAQRIADALRRSPDVKVFRIAGGENHSTNPCGSLTPHGYYGIEPQVVGDITRWMAVHGVESPRRPSRTRS
jgi:pimeloyl-ACP methyl ester carboxylesterase